MVRDHSQDDQHDHEGQGGHHRRELYQLEAVSVHDHRRIFTDRIDDSTRDLCGLPDQVEAGAEHR